MIATAPVATMDVTQRTGLIGGTTVSAIVGVNPYQTPHSAYLQLRGEVSSTPDNEAMERGRRYENVVAQMYQAAHPDTLVATDARNTGETALVVDPEHSYLMGHPDRYLLRRNASGKYDDVAAGLEIKTVNLFSIGEWGEDGTDRVPTHYLIQCQWYAGLTHTDEWQLAAAFLDTDDKVRAYREYTIRLDQELYERLRELSIQFWQEHVLPGIPPEITDADSTTKRWIAERYPRNIRPLETASMEEEVLMDEYIYAKKANDETSKLLEQAEAKLKLAIGDRDGIYSEQYGKATWKAIKDSERVDWKAVAAELSPPEEVIRKHTQTVAGTRRFCVRGGTYSG